MFANVGVVTNPSPVGHAHDGDVRDPPPLLRPEEKPTPAELHKLARELLSELARDDVTLALKMRELGVPPSWDALTRNKGDA